MSLQAAWVQKRGYDLGTKCRAYKPGILVYRYYPPLKKHKLFGSWDGPYEVVRQLSETTLLLRSSKGKDIPWHIDLLKPVRGYQAPKLVKIRGLAESLPHTEGNLPLVTDTLKGPDNGLRRSGRTTKPPQRYGLS